MGIDPTGLLNATQGKNNVGILVTCAHSTIVAPQRPAPGTSSAITTPTASSCRGPLPTIAGNWIGTDANGAALGNKLSGISILAGGHHAVVGGDSPAARNVIGDNSVHGVEVVGATNVRIAGNYIGVVGGTDPDGFSVTTTRGNHAHGVAVSATPADSGIVIEDNVISANDGVGVVLDNARGLRVVRNRIGTDVDGQASSDALGNTTGIVLLHGSTHNDIGAAGGPATRSRATTATASASTPRPSTTSPATSSEPT